MDTIFTEDVIPEIEYPRLIKRVQASFLDLLFIVFMMMIFANVQDVLTHFTEVPDWIIITFFIFIWLMYEPLCTTMGCTIGQWITRIRVVKVSDTHQRISFFAGIIRYVLKVSLGWISLLSISTKEDRRAIHDLAAGSVVICRQ